MDIKEISRRSGIGVVALSKALGLSRGAASQWKLVPAEHVLAVCELVGLKVTPHQIRPDLYPNPGDALPPDHPTPTGIEQEPGMAFGEFGEPRSGVERREEDRRKHPDPDFGDFGEPRDGERRQEDRRHCDEGAA